MYIYMYIYIYIYVYNYITFIYIVYVTRASRAKMALYDAWRGKRCITSVNEPRWVEFRVGDHHLPQ